MSDSTILWEGKPWEFWVRALHDPDDNTRWRAVDALRHIGSPTRTIDLFIEALSDPYWPARALATHALCDMAHEEEFIPLVSRFVLPLTNILSDESPDVALNAVYTLELLGPRAAAALPQLREAIGRDDERLRVAASDAISRIGC